MNWKYLLISIVTLLLAIVLCKALKDKKLVAKHMNDHSGIFMLTILQSWSIVISLAITSIIALLLSLIES